MIIIILTPVPDLWRRDGHLVIIGPTLLICEYSVVRDVEGIVMLTTSDSNITHPP